MKKLLFLLSALLGFALSLSGCSSYLYKGQYSTPGCYGGNPPVYYNNTRRIKTDTYFQNNWGVRQDYVWKNLRIMRSGFIVTVISGDKILSRYDLRVPYQRVCDVYHVTSLGGMELKVELTIRGGEGSINNLIVSDGYNRDVFDFSVK